MTEFEQYKQDRLQELEQLKALCLENKENIKALKEYWTELLLLLLYTSYQRSMKINITQNLIDLRPILIGSFLSL